jgi:RNA polymerase sigma-32 factor
MEKRLHSRDTIFDPAPDADDDHNFTPAAYLPAPDSDPAKQVEAADFNDDATTRMAAALNVLDDRARRIIEARWLTDTKMTLHELADEYGVSAERIRQLEANAIKKMRNAMAV